MMVKILTFSGKYVTAHKCAPNIIIGRKKSKSYFVYLKELKDIICEFYRVRIQFHYCSILPLNYSLRLTLHNYDRLFFFHIFFIHTIFFHIFFESMWNQFSRNFFLLFFILFTSLFYCALW